MAVRTLSGVMRQMDLKRQAHHSISSEDDNTISSITKSYSNRQVRSSMLYGGSVYSYRLYAHYYGVVDDEPPAVSFRC